MPRSLNRRLAVLTALGGCVAAATAPAFADTSVPIGVSINAVDTARQFAVLQPTTDTALTTLDFGDEREMPFRVRVRDQDKDVLMGGGFQVTANMTNLYLQNPSGSADPYSDTTKIDSQHVSIGYSANPLEALGVESMVKPRISVTGTIADCTSPTVRSALGILNPLGLPLNALLSGLTGVQDRVCDALAGGATVTQVVDGPLQQVDLAVGSALSVLDLPVGLSGSQEGGNFPNPAYGGAVAPAAPSGAAPATTRQIMSGTPALTGGLTAAVNGALTTLTGGTPLSLLSLDQLLEGLRANAALAPIVTALDDNALTDTQRRSLVSGLTGTLTSLLPASLPLVSGDYVAHPVLKINPVTTTPGVYGGTLTVDFFDGL